MDVREGLDFWVSAYMPLSAKDQSFTHNSPLSVKFNAVSGYLNSIRGYIRAVMANDSLNLSKWQSCRFVDGLQNDSYTILIEAPLVLQHYMQETSEAHQIYSLRHACAD